MINDFSDFLEKLGKQTIMVLGTVFIVLLRPFALLWKLIRKICSLLFRGFVYFICPAEIERHEYLRKVTLALGNMRNTLRYHFSSFPAVALYYIKKNNSAYRFSFRYLMYWLIPLASIALISGAVLYASSLQLALEVTLDGKVIGYVNSENDFSSAANSAQDIITGGGNSGTNLEYNVGYRFAYVKADEISSSADLEQAILESSSLSTEYACAVYIDGTLFGIIRNVSYAKNVFNGILENISADADASLVCFVQNIEYREGVYPSSVIMTNEAFSEKVNSRSTKDVYYTIVKGDTLTAIAAKYNTTANAIKELNPILKESPVVPEGTKIKVSSASGFLTLKVLKTETENETVEYDTIEVPSNVLYVGTSKKLSSGENGIDQVTNLVTYIDGKLVDKTEVSRLTVRESIPERKQIGTKALDSAYQVSMGGVFLWPIIGAYSINSDYGWRWGKIHGGMDLGMGSAPGTSLGKTVVAVAAGTVITATVHSQYGYYVIIDHGNGISTLYAHCYANSLMVSPGQTVAAGQPIAKVGSTGNSTGPHLHFEVRVNGNRVDPKPYLGI